MERCTSEYRCDRKNWGGQINAIRGKTADDDNAAEVDVKECTTVVKKYAYPGNENFWLYDLPGLGSPTFKRETYLKDIDFDKYDFFIILAESRFMDDDLWLANEVAKRGKKFYFARSKISNSVRDDKRAHPGSHCEKKVLDQIKKDLEQNLKDFKIKHIFLIDNYDTQLYDFGALTIKFIEDLTELKQDALTLSLTCLSKEVIAEKKSKLKQRIPMVATFAGLQAIPEEITLRDTSRSGLVVQEIEFYGKQLGIDTQSVEVGIDLCSLSQDDLEIIKETQVDFESLTEKIKEELSHFSNYIPLYGNIALGVKTAKFLEEQIDNLAEKAVQMHCVLTESLAKKHAS